MRTHAVVGLVKCPQHNGTYIIKCGCPAPTQETIRKHFKRLGVKIEPAKEPWLATIK